MRIRSVAALWAFFVLLVVGLNSYLGISALQSLQKTNLAIEKDSEITLNLRRLRTFIFGFHDYGLTTALTRSTDDLKQRDQYRQAASDHLNLMTEDLQLHKDPDFAEAFLGLKERINQLLELAPEQGSLEPDPLKTVFLHPVYRDLHEEVLDGLDALANKSARFLALDRERNQAFFRRSMRLSVVVLLVSVFLLALSIAFLRNRIILPIDKMMVLLQEVRAGNLAVRWKQPRPREDAVSQMGLTLNQTLEELERRRSERIEFIGSVAHDLKNPLSAISLNCEFSLKNQKTLSDGGAVRTIQRIKEQVDRLHRLTEDLLVSARQSRPVWQVRRESIDLKAVCQDALELIRASYPNRNFELIEISPTPPVSADKDRMTQVLTNLLSNAAKYSPEDAPVTLALERIEDFVSIEVQDRGPGISDADKVRIFEPFIRLHDESAAQTEGAGLGLAIVRAIVQAHEGSIMVHDRDGGGSTFRVTLPIA